MSFRVDEDGFFKGAVRFLQILLNAGCVSNTHVATDAAIVASKMQHQHRSGYAQESATSAADEARVIHVVKGQTGQVLTFKVGAVVANIGAAVVDVDLLKNGVSILTAAVQIDSGNAAYALVDATIDTDTLVEGDVLEVSIDGTAGGGTLAKGVFCYLDVIEDYV